MSLLSKSKFNSYMKIYLDDYDPKKLISKFDALDYLYRETKNFIEILSLDGIYYIENGNIFKLNVQDCSLIKKENFILDKSSYIKELTYSQIPYDHVSTNITSFYYGVNKNIQLVIEGTYHVEEDMGLMKKNKYNVGNKYYHFVPTNFYFLANEDFDFNQFLNREEINVFLSLLN